MADPILITNFRFNLNFLRVPFFPRLFTPPFEEAGSLPVILSYYTPKSVKAFRSYRGLKPTTHTPPVQNLTLSIETAEIWEENEFSFHRP